jgi:putative salt-induced outer membrane protein YdiY
MSESLRRLSFVFTIALLAGSGRAAAQAPVTPPPEPAPAWTGSAGLGLSLNRGNTTTTNFNTSFDATHDPKTRSVWKLKGLYQRGTTNGTLAVDRLLFEGRNERTFSDRVYAFVQLQFLQDEFKAIDYLVAPGAGLGYKLVATPVTTLNVDGGLGVKFEKNTTVEQTGDMAVSTSRRRTDAVVTASDKFEHKLSKTAAITQSFGALWKAQDFGDALYTFTAGVAASLTTRTQLKIELVDTYVSRPPNADVKSNDVALLTAFVYKF